MVNWFLRKIEKIQSDLRKKHYAEDDYFKIYTGDGVDYRNDIIAVEFLKGEYAGVVVSYTTCNIDSEGLCTFTIRIINNFKFDENILHKERRFKKILGQILILIIDKSTLNETEKPEEDDGFAEDYIEEPVHQRTIRKKSPSIS
jgi:hypothetical protein